MYRVGAVAALGPVEAGENIGSCSRSLCSSLSPPFCSVGIPLLLLLHCNLDNPTLLQIVQGNALCLVGISMLLYFAAAIWEGRGVSGKQADARSWISQAARTGSQGLDTNRGALIGQFEGGRFKLFARLFPTGKSLLLQIW